MSNLIIKARGMSGVAVTDVANLWICMGNSNQVNEKLGLTIEWLNPHFAGVQIEIADTLNRHHFMVNGASEDKALLLSRAMGDRWIEEHSEVLQKLTIAHTIVRWDEILRRPGVDYAQSVIANLFRQDEGFHTAVNEDVMAFYRRQNIAPTGAQIAASEKYILEEVAVDLASCLAGKVVCVYAGSQLQSMRYLRDKPRGTRQISLKNIHFVKLAFHANDNRET